MVRQLAGMLPAALVLATVSAPEAQQAAPVDGRVRDLLVLLDSRDEQSSADAVRELTAIGPSVTPAIVVVLTQRKGCQLQWAASAVLGTLKVEPALVESTLFAVAKGECVVRSPRDYFLMQHAALAILDRSEGIRVLGGLLRGRDPIGRARASLAFDDLTERLEAGHPTALAPTPRMLDATAEALPALRSIAASRDRQPTPCMAYEALYQAGKSAHPTLRDPAAKLLAGLKTACPTPSGELGRTSGGTVPLADVIARLDRQPPEEAAKIAAALVPVGAGAVPPLQAHLRKTNRCRGLALAGGILAQLGAAPADVEAAYVRVLAGECDGREPFDLALAQSVADTFMRDATGVARVTALLPHKDVEVRRRAAQAFAKAFEGLGPGEHGVAGAGARDPGIVPAMQAALAPLVTLGQNERDETARCQAVRALLLAQQAVHDALRAEAAAATTGRTLRCLAPPPR